MNRSALGRSLLIIAVFAFLGAVVTFTSAMQTVNVTEIEANDLNLSLDEEAYYEYVSPRVDRLVVEVNATREMVETKSRDIVALTRAGTAIDTLTEEIRAYGNEQSVPAKFAEVHARILGASDTVTQTLDEARAALRSFNFSGMTALVTRFVDAADEFTACQSDLAALVQ